nr:unnamed protein product [Callosobruchus analis]
MFNKGSFHTRKPDRDRFWNGEPKLRVTSSQILGMLRTVREPIVEYQENRDGFVYFARFLLDRLIDIVETEDPKDKIVKSVVFLVEIIIVLFIIFLIMGLIFMPVYVLAARIVSKVWGMVAW